MINSNILIVGSYPPPYGGISSNVRDLAPFLKKQSRGDVWVLTEDQQNSSLRVDDITVIRMNFKTIWSKEISWFNPFWFLKSLTMLLPYKLGLRHSLKISLKATYIRHFVIKNDVGFVIFMEDFINEAIIPYLKDAWKSNIPITSMAWGVSKQLAFFSKRKRMLNDIIVSSDFIWASSNYCARGVELAGVVSNKIQTIYLGVDTNHFKSNEIEYLKYRKDNKISTQSPIILFVGRMNQEMGLDTVLKIIPLVLSKNPDVKFILLGAHDNLTPDALKLQIQFPDNVMVQVNAPFSVVGSSMQICDVLLAPSLINHACMGMSIKEAMACGKVIVASNSGGIPEAIIDQESGFLFPANESGNVDIQNLYSILLSILADSPKREQIGYFARKRALELFSKDDTHKKMLEMFSSVGLK